MSFNIKLKYSNIKIAKIKIKYFVWWASTKLFAVTFVTRNTDLSLRHDISRCTQSYMNLAAAYYWDSETPGIHPHCKTLEYTSTSTPTSTTNIRIQVNNNYCHTRGILHQSIPIVLCHVWTYFYKKWNHKCDVIPNKDREVDPEDGACFETRWTINMF